MKSIMFAVAVLVCTSGAYADGLQTYRVSEVAFENFPPGSGEQALSWLISGPTIGGDDEVAVLIGITSIPAFNELGNDTFGAAISEDNGTEWAIGHVIFGTDFPVGYSLEATVELPTGSPASVPEAGMFSLMASALAGLGFLKKFLH